MIVKGRMNVSTHSPRASAREQRFDAQSLSTEVHLSRGRARAELVNYASYLEAYRAPPRAQSSLCLLKQAEQAVVKHKSSMIHPPIPL